MESLTGWIEKVTGAPSKNDTTETKKTEVNKEIKKEEKTDTGKNKKIVLKKTSTIDKKTAKKTVKKSSKVNISKGQNGKKSIKIKGKKPVQKRLPAGNQTEFIRPRENPTIPSKNVNRKSVAHIPQNRRQRPRPMLGSIKRAVSTIQYPKPQKFPQGTPMKVIPMGGLNEVGKNSMCIEYDGDIIIIDIGLQFPEENMPGVDYVIPDLSYALERKDKIKGLVITHGHLDHIGAIHHYIEKLGFPTIYASRLTKALIEKRLEEHKLLDKVKIILVDPKKPESRFRLGKFTVEYFSVAHSIPDSCGVFVKTDAGSMIHTGDFKFDFTPTDGMQVDYDKLVRFSQEGVDVIFADSTNATKPGYCPSEKAVEENIGLIMREAVGKRLIITTFASSLGRHIAIIRHAVANGRKIFLGGRSMNDNVRIAHELAVIDVPASAIRKLDRGVNDYRPEEILILTTGSQGEPFAALSRISRDEHPFITIDANDIIAFSSSPIPGNERGLYTVVDAIYRKGSKIISKLDIDIHASGHGFQGDIQMMHSLVRPTYVAPIHGEYFMRVAHRNMVMNDMGYAPENVPMLENGSVLEILGGVARKGEQQFDAKLIFIDGCEHADISEDLLAERTALAEGGLITVVFEVSKSTKKLQGEPKIYSEGFLDNAQVHGVILDYSKKSYTTAHNRFGEDLTEEKVQELVTPSLREEMQREVDREPVIQVIVLES